MPRVLLLSLFAVGIVCGFVGRATYASFSDQLTADGEVTAGTLVINVTSTALVFNLPVGGSLGCPSSIVLNGACSASKTVVNGGTLAGVISIDSATISSISGGASCTTGDWDVLATFIPGSAGGSTRLFPAGDTENLYVEVRLTGAGCDGATATVSVVLSVAQAANPHGTADD